MAILNAQFPTLDDIATRLDPNGQIAQVIELMSQSNEALEDMVFVEGNLPTGHKTTVRTGLPEGTWRLLNYGVKQEKSTTAQVVDTCGMLESYAEVDISLAKLNGNTAAFRLSEDRAFIEGMNQSQADTLFFGDSSLNPERFTGLAPRYNTINGAESGENILDAGGTGNNLTSVWLVVWGNNTVHGIYPKGSQAGLQVSDLGEVTLIDPQGGRYQGYRTHYKWDTGLTVRDWRYVVRIANVNPATLTKDASAGADLIDLITEAIERIPTLGMGRPAIYTNRKVRSFLRRQITSRVINSTLTMDEVAGKRVLAFDGIPVRRTDALKANESKVS